MNRTYFSPLFFQIFSRVFNATVITDKVWTCFLHLVRYDSATDYYLTNNALCSGAFTPRLIFRALFPRRLCHSPRQDVTRPWLSPSISWLSASDRPVPVDTTRRHSVRCILYYRNGKQMTPYHYKYAKKNGKNPLQFEKTEDIAFIQIKTDCQRHWLTGLSNALLHAISSKKCM